MQGYIRVIQKCTQMLIINYMCLFLSIEQLLGVTISMLSLYAGKQKDNSHMYTDAQ